MRTKTRLLIAALAALLPAIAAADDADPRDVLRRAIDPPAVVYEGDMTVSYWHNRHSSAEEVHVAYNPPDRYRWQFLLPDGRVDRTILSDGETQQLQIITGRRTLSGDAPKAVAKKMSSEQEWNLLLANYDVSLEKDEEIAGRNCRVIRLHPRAEGKPVQRLWVDRSSGVILQIRRFRPHTGTGMVSRLYRFQSWTPGDKSAPVLKADAETNGRPGTQSHPIELDYLSREELAKDGRFMAPVPADLRDGFVFESADFMRMKGETVHQVRYTDGLCVLSLFQTPRPTKKPSSSDAEGSRTGMLELVTWKQQGRNYTLMGDVSRDMLQDLAKSFRPAH